MSKHYIKEFLKDNPLVEDRMVDYLLDQKWHDDCEIIPDYMPPYPSKGTRPTVVVRYNNGKEHPPYLRYSKGPRQGFSWDIYGDDFHNVELALIALSRAPFPKDVSPITFTIPIETKVEEK